MQHCGYLVRDRLPISAREWKQKINEPHVSFVSDLNKNLMWDLWLWKERTRLASWLSDSHNKQPHGVADVTVYVVQNNVN